ncbi:metallo-beta-lactamase superfamily protein [Amniculicola lignicola CBS 123094]|uniref:Metallo-beta-lactamase superfamily protein n=1 Tax=Amniculicola lignicola CBS 123094 TaxID=1392246 RepID=A0A6A5WJF6_9PLEO|nr:metallo-beta-lactamase superfamily protein [Amniculicola lignicola CBS 123094]
MLVPLDNLSILAIVDNEVDPMSPAPPCVTATGNLGHIALGKGTPVGEQRGGGMVKEIAMEQLCCGAHGLSLMLTATKDGVSQTLLFDTGPTESIFEANAKRLQPPLQNISHIHLSHWHRDHSGGMLAAIKLIKSAKASASTPVSETLPVDLHPARPDYRGFTTPMGIVSLEADPSFAEIEAAGGVVEKYDASHEVLNNHFLISGEIPRVTGYEKAIPPGMRYESGEGKWVPDQWITDERFVVCHVKDKGLVLFTGCSHAGVVNAAKHAVALIPEVPLYAIVGGFHLADAVPEIISTTIKDLKELGVKVLMAGHCTGWRAKFEIEKEMPGSLVPSFVGITTVI